MFLRTLRRLRHRRGAMLILVALLLIVFLGTAALSVDVAYMHLTQTQLRAATDAAARAGGEALGRTGDVGQARAAAQGAAALNQVAGQPLGLDSADVVFGLSRANNDGTWSFEPREDLVNSVRVLGRRTAGSPGGPVALFFGGVLGRSTFEPTKTATVVFENRDICLTVDISHSMMFDLSGVDYSYPPFKPGPRSCQAPHETLSRWAAVRGAVDVFRTTLRDMSTGEQVGLVSYSSAYAACSRSRAAATIEQTLSTDLTLIESGMTRLSNGEMLGNTNIYAGIQSGITVLTDAARMRKSAEKVMIVLTDGVATDGASPLLAAQDAKAKRITIHTVTFSGGADQTTMKQVALTTGGTHYHAPTPAELVDIFRKIALATSLSFSQ